MIEEMSLWCRKCNIAVQVTAVEFFNTGLWLFYRQLFLRSIGNIIARHSKQSVVISDMILPGHMVVVRNLCCVYVWPFYCVVCCSWQMEEVTSTVSNLKKILETVYNWNTKIWKNFAKSCCWQNTKLQHISEFPHTSDILKHTIL